MESKSKILGHPAHPILITFPLGLLVTSVGFDVAGVYAKREDWNASGYWMAVAGTVTGVASAVPGLIDYLAIPQGTRAKRIGLLHGLGNAVVLGLFAGSLAARKKPDRQASTLSLTTSLAGMLLVMGTGWLGGELVDRLGVGVDTGANLNATNSLSS